jgi:hypothetical protein
MEPAGALRYRDEELGRHPALIEAEGKGIIGRLDYSLYFRAGEIELANDEIDLLPVKGH